MFFQKIRIFFKKIPIIRKFIVFSKNPYFFQKIPIIRKILVFSKNPYNSKISGFFEKSLGLIFRKSRVREQGGKTQAYRLTAAGGNFLSF